MQIVTHKFSKLNNLKTYFTNKPCKHGHISERWTSTRTCCECAKQKLSKWRGENPEKMQQARNTWNANNPERVKAHKKAYHEKHGVRNNELDKVKRREDPIRYMLYRAKYRASKAGVEFALTDDDISIPDKCPILGIDMNMGDTNSTDSSPSLDRLIPKMGYVVGNVHVISSKANRIKNNATLDELVLICEYIKHNSDIF